MMKNVYSVGQVNTYIKNMFAQDFMLQRISVKGEVSNCKYHTSGHIYFTIKDAAGTLNGQQKRSEVPDERRRPGCRDGFGGSIRA